MKMKHAQFYYLKDPTTGMYARLDSEQKQVLWDAVDKKQADLFDRIAILFAEGKDREVADRKQFLAWCSRLGGKVRSVKKAKAVKRNVMRYLLQKRRALRIKAAIAKMEKALSDD